MEAAEQPAIIECQENRDRLPPSLHLIITLLDSANWPRAAKSLNMTFLAFLGHNFKRTTLVEISSPFSK